MHINFIPQYKKPQYTQAQHMSYKSYIREKIRTRHQNMNIRTRHKNLSSTYIRTLYFFNRKMQLFNWNQISVFIVFWQKTDHLQAKIQEEGWELLFAYVCRGYLLFYMTGNNSSHPLLWAEKHGNWYSVVHKIWFQLHPFTSI